MPNWLATRAAFVRVDPRNCIAVPSAKLFTTVAKIVKFGIGFMEITEGNASHQSLIERISDTLLIMYSSGTGTLLFYFLLLLYYISIYIGCFLLLAVSSKYASIWEWIISLSPVLEAEMHKCCPENSTKHETYCTRMS